MEYVTASGLVVHDKRVRAFPRDTEPASGEVVDSNVMYADTLNGCPVPPAVQPWAGWPVEWATPTWGSMVGLGEIMRRVGRVFAAIDKQAWQIATMPPYRTRNGEVVSKLAWMRNPQRDAYTGWIEAARQIMFSFLGSGEVFLWATSRFDDSNRVASWVMLNPGWVNVELTGHVRTYTLGGEDITADVLHIRYASWPGDARGHGPLEAAARAMFSAQALEQYECDLATRGGIPWGIITAPGRLTADQATDMRTQYVTARLGARGAPAVFSGGATLNTLNISPKDMALLELRQFDEALIAVLLGVPPFLVALPSGGDSLTYSTTAGFYDFHWRSALRPFAAMLTEAIGNWALMNPDEALELNRDEYTRPAFAERVDAWAALHAIKDDDGKRAVDVPFIQKEERLTSAPGTRPAVASESMVPT